jgi:hypothetical protein
MEKKERTVKTVYLVLAHNSPAHLGRMVQALAADSAAFLVHIDKKADLNIFRAAAGDAVNFTRERVAVHWGDFSQVEAILVLMREALADTRKFDRFVLLSGTDYPLRSPAYIADFFARHPETQFISMSEMSAASATKPLTRLSDYVPPPATSALARLVRKVKARLGIRPKQRDYKAVLGDLVPYAGATWWALSRKACEHIEEFVLARPAVLDFFRNTVCPDEMFFHTIIGNSVFASDLQRDRTYTDWAAGGASPAYMSMRHIDHFRTTRSFPVKSLYGGGEILFARKFSEDAPEVLAALDLLLQEEHKDTGRASPVVPS